MAYLNKDQVKSLLSGAAPENRSAVLKNLVAKGYQIEGFNDNSAPAATTPKLPAPSATPTPTAPKSPSFLDSIGEGLTMGLDPGAYMRRKAFEASPDYQTLSPEQKTDFGGQFNTFKNVGKAADAFSESTIKPIAQFGAGALATGAKTYQGLTDSSALLSQELKKRGKQDWGALNVVNPDMWGLAMSEEGGKPLSPEVNTQLQNVHKEATAPVNMPWLGNINFNQANKEGQYDFGKSMINEGAAGADALMGVQNLINPIKPNGWGSVGQAGFRGAVQGGSKEIKNNRDASLQDVALSAGGGGAMSAGMQALQQFLPVLKQKLSQGQGKAAGLTDETIETLKTPGLGEKAVEQIPGAKQAKINPANFDDPMQKVGQENLKGSVEDVIKKNRDLGKQLNKVLSTSDARITTGDAKSALGKELMASGGTFSGGQWKFGPTSSIRNDSDIKAINQLWADLTKYSNKPIKPTAIYNIISGVDDQIDYSNKAMVPIGDNTTRILKNVRSTLSDNLKTSVKDSQVILDEMSANHDLIDFFNPKLGENSSSASVLRNLFSPNQKDALKSNLGALEKTTGREIINPTRAAKAAMDVAGDVGGKNLLETTSGGAKNMILETLRRAIFRPESAAKNIVKSSATSSYTPSIMGGRGIGVQALLNLLGVTNQ